MAVSQWANHPKVIFELWNESETIGSFNGGPGSDTLPHIQITNFNGQSYDYELSGLTKAGVTIFAKQAGIAVTAPKNNVLAQGY